MEQDVKDFFYTSYAVILVTVSIIGIFLFYSYKINSKFIENGYQQTTIQGYSTLVWQKIKD